VKKLILGLSLLASAAFAQEKVDPFLMAPNFDLRSALQSVGYMFMKNPEGGTSFCNFALIGERHAITNHHCMPNESICKSAQLHFTNDGEHVAGIYKCTKILKTVDIQTQGNNYSDFTILELNEPAGMYHGYFPIARETPRGEFKVWRVKYDPPGYIKATISANYARCLAEKSYDPQVKENFLKIKQKHMGETCHSMRGNSGGALLNDNGEFVGLVSEGTIVDNKKNESVRHATNEIMFDFIGGVLLERIEELYPNFRDLNR
jgi:V8-like Glu-specific endopeptidase